MVDRDLCPRWDAYPVVMAVPRAGAVLRLEVFDHDVLDKDDLLGVVEVNRLVGIDPLGGTTAGAPHFPPPPPLTRLSSTSTPTPHVAHLPPRTVRTPAYLCRASLLLCTR